MARILGHQQLDVTKPIFAKKPLTLDGVDYLPGQQVDIARLQPRLVRVLHDQRKLGHETYADVPRGAEALPVRKPTQLANPPKPLPDAPGVVAVEKQPAKRGGRLA